MQHDPHPDDTVYIAAPDGTLTAHVVTSRHVDEYEDVHIHAGGRDWETFSGDWADNDGHRQLDENAAVCHLYFAMVDAMAEVFIDRLAGMPLTEVQGMAVEMGVAVPTLPEVSP